MHLLLGTFELDLATIVVVASPIIGLAGLLFGILSHRWTRRESRLQALTEVLRPFIRAMQELNDANNRRRTCEQLRRSFPDPSQAPDVVERVNSMVEQYNELLEAGLKECKAFEFELTTRHFRFPDRLAATLKVARDDVFHFGQLVSDGRFDQADIYFAKIKDQFKRIGGYARGWRLADPFEWLKVRFNGWRKQKTPIPSRFALTQTEMNRIFELVHKRATTQSKSPFAIHPPKKLLDNPGIAEADDVIEQLDDSIFEVIFQDGTYAMFSLTELMVFTYQLIFLSSQAAEVDKMFQHVESGEFTVQITYHFREDDIMRPEIVKTLLSKIEFSDSPSDTSR